MVQPEAAETALRCCDGAARCLLPRTCNTRVNCCQPQHSSACPRFSTVSTNCRCPRQGTRSRGACNEGAEGQSSDTRLQHAACKSARRGEAAGLHTQSSASLGRRRSAAAAHDLADSRVQRRLQAGGVVEGCPDLGGSSITAHLRCWWLGGRGAQRGRGSALWAGCACGEMAPCAGMRAGTCWRTGTSGHRQRAAVNAAVLPVSRLPSSPMGPGAAESFLPT